MAGLALVIVPGIAPAAVAQERPVVGAATSVASDCTKDVTAELSAWLNAAPRGSTMELRPGGCYRIDGTVRVVGRWDLTLLGNGATLQARGEGDRNRRHLSFVDGGGLRVQDLVVRGVNPHAGTAEAAYRADREAQHAFELLGVHGAVLSNVQAYDVYGDFVYVGMGSGNGRAESKTSRERWSRDITVENSTFARNGRQGVAVTAGQNVRIVNNKIDDVRRAVFDLEPNGVHWGARHILIEGNTTGRSRLLWLAAHGRAGDVGDVVVRDNTMTALSGVPVISVKAPSSAARRGPWTVTGNRFKVAGSPAPGFRFARTSDVSFADNVATFDASRKMTATSFTDSVGVQLRDNVFKGAARIR